MAEIIKTYTVTFASPHLVRRFERFLALLHFNSGFGHSGLFAMALDGDGDEKITLKNQLDKSMGYEVNAIGDVGGHIEIAMDDGYRCDKIDYDSSICKYKVHPSATLYKDREVVKVIPSRLWEDD